MSGRKFVDVLNKDLITRIKGPEGSPPQLQNPDVSGANRMKSMYAAADLHDGTCSSMMPRRSSPSASRFIIRQRLEP
jgi:hypothetical protein